VPGWLNVHGSGYGAKKLADPVDYYGVLIAS
jgi:hypothetical protein